MSDTPPTISIIFPAKNEGNNVKTTLDSLFTVKTNTNFEAIVIDDGSTDGTREILEELKKKYNNIKIIFHEKNFGKGTAIRTALKEVKGDIVIIQDADLEYDPNEYPKLIEPILKGETQVVYGSRVLRKNPKASTMFYIGGRFISFITNLLYGTKITDEPTCYKVFTAKLLKSINLECKRFDFCPEVTAKIAKMGYKIVEVPISYRPRSVKEGKKVSWKDGIIAVLTLLKYKFKN